jgi:threonine dehydrogenase-like Zn-dependent dehydrogenase
VQRIDVPVLIVGAGPVGTIAAICSHASASPVVSSSGAPVAARAGGARRQRAHLRDLPRAGVDMDALAARVHAARRRRRCAG